MTDINLFHFNFGKKSFVFDKFSTRVNKETCRRQAKIKFSYQPKLERMVFRDFEESYCSKPRE